MSAVTPDGIDGLHALVARTWPAVQLFDGPETKWPEQEFIAVGLGPTDPDTRALREPAGKATTALSADVTVLIRGWSGDTGIRARRRRTYELLDGIVAAVDADRTLGGLVSHTEVVDDTYVPAQGRNGALADLVVTVRVRRF